MVLSVAYHSLSDPVPGIMKSGMAWDGWEADTRQQRRA